MANTSEFIDGIFLYCDRWCERCAFTAQCLHYTLEAEESAAQKEHAGAEKLDIPFWIDIGETLVQTMRLVRELAVAEGIDTEHLEFGTPDAPPVAIIPNIHTVSGYYDAREHPYAQAALEYAGMVNNWFVYVDEELSFHESLLSRPPAPLQEPINVIRRYQYLIYPKIVRTIEAHYAWQASAHAMLERDACGTAKVVLIALDRSLEAWTFLYDARPKCEDKTLAILLHLDRLRRSLEVLLPAARNFIRPGLDE